MELLQRLVDTPGVPGREHRIRELIRSEAEVLFDEVRTDTLGSLICLRKPRPRGGAGSDRPMRIMLAGHMDQIGFLVRHIDEKGFLRLNAVGGFDTRNLFSRLVRICPDLRDPEKDLNGVLNPAGKPVHIASDEEKKKIPELHEFAVDLGMPPEMVREKVRLGDMVTFQASLTQVGQTCVAPALDNRIACWIILRAVEALDHHDCEIHAVFTVQEEVGLRGAGAAAFGVEPDVALAVDTTLCVDTPGVPEDQQVTRQGDGAALTVMDSASIADLPLLEHIEQLAEQRGIKQQRSVLPRGGTDAGAIQRSRDGVRTMTLSCPTRYIHTAVEMIHKTDMDACRDLLAAYLTNPA